MIQLEDVSKTYSVSAAAVEALKGVTLNIDRGEYVAVLGPSGSGKSTLMHIIGCLDTPTSGSYLLEGASVVDLSRDELADIRSRWIGFVFQSFHLLPQATATENVELPLVFANVPAQKRHQRAEELLDRVGLGHRLRHLPGELSGGERQRVAIARALANEPIMTLADEPTGNLDSAASEDILALFDELNREGRTVIVVTHETHVARHARRVIRLLDGAVSDDVRQAGGQQDGSVTSG
jgi:putative ABC transport system ATP-binding protein